MKEKQKYVHYGSSEFIPELFDEIENEPWEKPLGGLWASPVDSPKSWKRHVEINRDLESSHSIKHSFTFTLAENSKVAHIYSVEDLEKLPIIDNGMRLSIWLDFEQMIKDGYDAIELHLSEEKIDETDIGNSLYWKLYTWDVDSILIMNPDIIQLE